MKEPKYRVADVPGKSRGLVSTKEIAAGEIVLREPYLFKGGSDGGEDLAAAIEEATGVGLDPELVAMAVDIWKVDEGREAVDLSWESKYKEFAEWLDDGRGVLEREGIAYDTFCKILAVIQENSFLDSDGATPLLFKTASRANHSCLATANLEPHVHDGEITLKSRRKIAPNEELTIDYLNQEMEDAPPAERRNEITERRGFACGCEHCQSVEDVKWEEIDRKMTLCLAIGDPRGAEKVLDAAPTPKARYLSVKLYRALRDYALLTKEYPLAALYATRELESLPENTLSTPRALLLRAIAVKKSVKPQQPQSEYPLIDPEKTKVGSYPTLSIEVAERDFQEAVVAMNILLPEDRPNALQELVAEYLEA
eukprot:TRINITY_DN4526_c0_g1_i2.p1 TRINITY_DN4526_c0_g1~~TRINITY_DN4526_c0_g1_i2.p1  ORF type:complete len:385 (+),score=49.92 TRINITY_DN4526_c0_g1_i2:52-1155(+)